MIKLSKRAYFALMVLSFVCIAASVLIDALRNDTEVTAALFIAIPAMFGWFAKIQSE